MNTQNGPDPQPLTIPSVSLCSLYVLIRILGSETTAPHLPFNLIGENISKSEFTLRDSF